MLPNPQISIVVPVYKVEQYLPRCIESILNQNFKNIELLLIDDGSPDKSGEICDEYAKKDFRIRVFHKKNGGVSSARNLGLEKAKGEWISFVDSDDWINSDCFDFALKGLDGNVDCYIWGLKRIKEGTSYIPYYLPYRTWIDNDLFTFIANNKFKEIIAAPWGKLFRRNIIIGKSLKFNDKLSFGEDRLFNFTYFTYSKSIVSLNQYSYNYLWVVNSLSHKDIPYTQYFILGKSLVDLIIPWTNKSKNKYFAGSMKSYLFSIFICCIGALYNDTEINNEIKKKMTKEIYKIVISRNICKPYNLRSYIEFILISMKQLNISHFIHSLIAK